MKKTQNKFLPLIAGAIIQLCLGIIYIWSIFKAPFVAYYSQTVAERFATTISSLTYSIMLAAFVLGIIIGGRFNDKKGPRPVVFMGGMMFSIGILLSSLSATFIPSLPWLICIFYGGVAGFGVGAAYISTISCAQKWFPDKKGFATGIIACTFGASTVIFTPAVNMLLASAGVSQTFLLLSLIFLAVILVFAWFVKNPSPEYMQAFNAAAPQLMKKKQYRPGEMLKTRQYYLILFSMLLLTPAYFILNPLFKSLAESRGLLESTALASVMITGVASAAGRLIAPWISDRIGRKNAIFLLFCITLASVLLLIPAQGYVYTLLIACVSFAFGGSAGIFPAVTGDYFGTAHGGINYGLVTIALAASALIFPTIATSINVGGSATTLTFVIPAIACVIGLIITSFLKPPLQKSEV
jgi:OFA family oxalate/formate antiporter-like MFS transporter